MAVSHAPPGFIGREYFKNGCHDCFMLVHFMLSMMFVSCCFKQNLEETPNARNSFKNPDANRKRMNSMKHS
jgi:hypothetical protein